MSPLLIFGSALSSVGTNKLRTGLTLLGVVIGVSSVIALMSIGRGSQSAITDRIQELGTNILFVSPALTADGSTNELTLGDIAALENGAIAPDISAVAAQASGNATLLAGKNQSGAQILGVTSNYLDVRDFTLASGRPITPSDVINGTDVLLLGPELATTLYGNVSAVGQRLKVNGRAFTVIGVLEPKGGFGLEDNRALAPITTVQLRLNGQSPGQDAPVDQLSVQAASSDATDEATSQIRLALSLHKGVGFDPDNSGFSITNQQDAVDTLEDTNQTFVVFLGSIAGISLAVGAIGVMNIMLVSVTERTREIGIQRALGATKRVILSQFVTEATILSIGGGALGVILGIVISILIDGASIGSLEINTRFSGDIAVLALGVSAAIGLAAGIYPAMRAAALDPIEALRHE